MVLKNVYQQAGIALALPDPTPPQRKEEDYSRGRIFLRSLLEGYVNGDDRSAPGLRKRYQGAFDHLRTALSARSISRVS